MHLTLGVDLPAQCLPSFEWLNYAGISACTLTVLLWAVAQAGASPFSSMNSAPAASKRRLKTLGVARRGSRVAASN